MAKLGISTGIIPNDGTGDNLLTGAIKINKNFDEIYTYFGDGVSLTSIGGTWSVTTVGIHTLKNVGIGTTNPVSKLTVHGDGKFSGVVTATSFSGNVSNATYASAAGIATYATSSGIATYATSSGIASALTSTASINTSGIITATSFVGDGSGLTGVVGSGSGSGIVVKDSGSTVGTAGTIDFGANLTVSPISSGVVTVTASGGGGVESYWSSTSAGIHTLSSVGIGTTNPTSALTVGGGTSTRELYVTGVSTFRNPLDIFGSISFKTPTDENIFSISYESNNDDISFNWQQSGGTGGSQILWYIPETSSFVMRNPAIDEKLAQFTTGGSVELYYDGSKKFETIGAGVTVTGTTFTNQLNVSGVSTFQAFNSYVEIGSPGYYAGLRLISGGTEARVEQSGAGDLRLTSHTNRDISLNSYAIFGDSNNSGNVQLNNGNVGITKVGSAITFTANTGNIQAASLSVSGISTFNDNVRVVGIVTSSKVLISNDGGNNGSLLIEDTGAYSQLTFRASNGTDQASIQGVEGNLYITPGSNGHVSLPGATTNIFYSSGNVIFNNGLQGTTTFSNGFTVTNGNVGIGTTNATSALTVKGNTSLETLSVSGISTFTGRIVGPVRFSKDGSLTATQNVEINADGSYAFLNVGGSSSLYFDLPNTIIRNTYSGGRIRMDSPSGIDFEQYGLGGEYRARFDDSSVSLYSSNSKKFETIGAGVTVTGTTFTNQLNVSGVSTFQSNVYIGDSDVLNFGNSNNLQISHNPGVTPYNFINGGTTVLTIRSGDIDIQSGSQNYTSFSANNTDTRISWAGTNSNAQRVKVDQTSVELYTDVKVLPIGSASAKFSVGTGGTVIATTSGGLVGIGTTNPTDKLTVRDGDISVGVSTAHGIILTSPNGTRFRLIVADDGTISSSLVS